MTIQRRGNELIIQIPDNVDMDGLQRLIDYIEYSQLTVNSKATQKEVNELSSNVNKGWWNKHKDRLMETMN